MLQGSLNYFEKGFKFSSNANKDTLNHLFHHILIVIKMAERSTIKVFTNRHYDHLSDNSSNFRPQRTCSGIMDVHVYGQSYSNRKELIINALNVFSKIRTELRKNPKPTPFS